MPMPYAKCPKCGHHPLPANQALPSACPACGVILAKVGQMPRTARAIPVVEVASSDDEPGWPALLTDLPDRVDPLQFWFQLAVLVGLLLWSWVLVGLDYRTGEMGASFLHRPLLIFHEAGHAIFMPLGHWMMILGGTLGQLIMPLILGGALLVKNRDPFGAAVGLWFLGVSVMDVAPYMYDALHPQLMLLSGSTGEEGGHDWIYLFSSVGLLQKAQVIGSVTHKLGALVTLLALAWGTWLLRQQYLRKSQEDAVEQNL
jgi:hypothetical protein